MARVRFGDVIKEIKINIDRATDNHEFYIAGEHMETENIHLTKRGRFEGSDVGPAFIRLFRPGQVLYGSRRTYLKKVAVADFEGITSNTTFVLETKDQSVMMQELLPFIMLTDSFTEYAIRNSKGSTNPYILFSDLCAYEFELPAIEEQHILATRLLACDNVKEAYKRLLTATDELVKSQFVEMFGNPVSNAMAWQMRPLKETCTLMTGNTPSRAEKEYYGSYIEWIKSDNITNPSLYLTTAAESLSEKGAEVGRIVHPGAILMTCIAGSLNTIGNVAIVDRDVAFNQQINAIIPHQYDTLFLCYLLKLLKPKLHEVASSALKCILNKGNLEAFTAIVPDIALQKEFSSFVAQSDKSKFAAQQALADLTATQKALMRQYLG